MRKKPPAKQLAAKKPAPKRAATKPPARASAPGAEHERLVELELRFMHQQALLDELSGVLFAQQTTIDKLEARVKDLERRIADLGEPIPIEKPPHY